MVKAAGKGLCRLLRQIDVAADKGVLKTELAGLAVGDLSAVLAEEFDGRLDLGFADGAGLVGPVNREKAHRKAALAAGVDVDEAEIFVIEIVGRLAAHKQHAQEGARVAAELAHIGRRQEGDGNAFGEEELGQRRGVLDGSVGDDEVFSAVHVQRRQNHDDGGHEVHRGQGGKPVLLVEGDLPVDADRVNRPLEIAVLVQDALGAAGRAGGVDGIGGIVLVRVLVPGKRGESHDLVPVLGTDLKPAAAVLADIADALRRIGVLHQGPGSAGLPHADHGDDGQHAAGQVDEHKVLPADFVLLQPAVYAAGEIVQLGIGDALCMRIVKQNRRTRVHPGIALQSLNDGFQGHAS